MTLGEDEPDARGRTGLHLTGRDLAGNPRVAVREVEVQQRETYDRGNGATILLYDRARRTVLLTRQFRYPAYVNGHPDGMLLETAAGLLDDDDAETAIRREAAEETGHAIGEVEHLFDAYMSPGSVTEKLHFYAAPYDATTSQDVGGGLAEEGEHIEVVELALDDALDAIGTSIIDAKTILLLQWAVLAGPFADRPGREDSSRAPSSRTPGRRPRLN